MSELTDVLQGLGVVNVPDESSNDVDTDTGDELEDVWLSVGEFCYQEEVGKNPSQIYNWISKDNFPHRIKGKKKEINFREGVLWIRAREKARAGGYRVTAMPAASRGRKKAAKDAVAYKGYELKIGDYLSWDRGNNLGPAYARVVQILETLVTMSVEYRMAAVYLTKESIKSDLATGKLRVVHETEVKMFILNNISRLHFLVSMLHDVPTADRVRDDIYATGVLTPDFVEVAHGERARRWPTKEQLVSLNGDEEV